MKEHSTSKKSTVGKNLNGGERSTGMEPVMGRPVELLSNDLMSNDLLSNDLMSNDLMSDDPEQLGSEQLRSVTYSSLEDVARRGVQKLLQRVLEEEVTELLGRCKSERILSERIVVAGSGKDPEDSALGYRNGYGKLRRLSTSIGTVTVRRPRVRGLDEPFVSRVLPLFKRHTQQVGEMLPQLYLHGLAQADFDLALRGLLGEGAPLSASSIGRLKAVWQAEYEHWKQRPLGQEALGGRQVVYVWVDGIYVKAGLEKEKAALLVVIGALSDGSKEVLALECGHRESTASWSSILRDLKKRGMNCPKLVVGDGHLGIWGALANVYPEANEQRCWNHRIINVLDRISKKHQATAKEMLRKIHFSQSRKEAEEAKQSFQAWAKQQGQTAAAELLEQDWERMMSFYNFPKEHWKHLRTTNVVESPFASVRLRTDAAKRYKKAENATAAIWKLLMVAEMTFRKLTAPELLLQVAAGCQYQDGVLMKTLQQEGQDEGHEELAA